jgi:hypothetical protein
LHIIFTFFQTFGLGNQNRVPKTYFDDIRGHICSYYFHIIVYAWAGAPVNSAIFAMSGAACAGNFSSMGRT